MQIILFLMLVELFIIYNTNLIKSFLNPFLCPITLLVIGEMSFFALCGSSIAIFYPSNEVNLTGSSAAALAMWLLLTHFGFGMVLIIEQAFSKQYYFRSLALSGVVTRIL